MTLVVDCVEHLDLIDAIVPPALRPELRICLDVDASLRAAGGRVYLGVRRSPAHSPEDAAALARAVVAREGFRLVGLMAYEAQIAGGRDAPATGPSAASPCAAAEPAVTEVAAGSGPCSHLFDGYRAFAARSAAFFALP